VKRSCGRRSTTRSPVQRTSRWWSTPRGRLLLSPVLLAVLRVVAGDPGPDWLLSMQAADDIAEQGGDGAHLPAARGRGNGNGVSYEEARQVEASEAAGSGVDEQPVRGRDDNMREGAPSHEEARGGLDGGAVAIMSSTVTS